MNRGNQVVRRRGRPNKGGGNRGGRGRGGSAGGRGNASRGRGGSFARKVDPYDYDDLPVVNEAYDRDDRVEEKCTQAPRRFPRTRVTMQRLNMSSENQEMVKDMLKTLHGDYTDELSDPEYDELDWRAEDQYWMADNRLVVESVDANQARTEEEKQERQVERFTQLAVDKLQRYGFDKSRCEEALSRNGGDIGQSLEYLLSECFSLKWRPPQSRDPDRELEIEAENETPGQETEVTDEECLGDEEWDEIYEQRTEEKLALESIYGENFKENIANKVWTITVNMEILSRLSSNQAAGNKKRPTHNNYSNSRDNKNLCRFYLKGNCSYGSKCKFKHQSPHTEDSVTRSRTKDNDEDAQTSSEYQLEIRFPEGNKYPQEPPFIAFQSTNSLLPKYVSLSITSRLVNEARIQGEGGLPIVYSLVSLLESEEEVTALFEAPAVPFSLPPPVISRKQDKQAAKSSLKWKKKSLTKQMERDLDFDDGNSGADLKADAGGMTQQEPEVKHTVRREVLGNRKTDHREIESVNLRLKQQFKKIKEKSEYQSMAEKRKQLPAWGEQEGILETLSSHQVVVVSGMTGCGKTTQVPQFILDKSLSTGGPGLVNIVCTQPRRISAIAVSERVAAERAERLGNTVGYQIRLESVMSSRTRLLFCTTGILLRRLEGEASLEDVTHVIVDEVHERSEESDFLLLILRDLLPNRPDLRIILMSATLNADMFSDYFGGCPVIDIPGRTFPVEQLFLEDAIEHTGYVLEENSPFSRPLKKQNAIRHDTKKHTRLSVEEIEDELEMVNLSSGMPPKDTIQDQNLSPKQLFLRFSGYKKSTVKSMALMDYEKINLDLIESLIDFIVFGKHEFPKSGAILVFLPGYAEIQSLFDQLKASHVTGGKNKVRFKIIPLHSTLSSEDQQSVFLKPKEGVTKIVLSTNIAETSVTIDDVVFVIDCGLMKEKRYDPGKGMESLDTVWVSRANAMQRKGRAGRVASGVCFHLFTHHRYDWHLRDQPIPEIQRVPLEQTVLKIKILPVFQGLDMEEVMYRLIEAPSDVSIQSAVKRLQDLGALDYRKELTPLGYHLAALPVDVRIGKLMLFGAIFRCLDPVLTIAATLSFKSPFVAPFGRKEEATAKKLELAVRNSDHLTMLKAYRGWCEAERQSSYRGYSYCQENYLSLRSLQMLSSMKRQFAELLSDIGFIKEGISSRDLERLARNGSDGVKEGCGAEANSNSENYKLLAAILVAALYPNVVQVFTPESKFHQSSAGAIPMAPKAEEIKFKTRLDGYVNIHPSSVNFQVRFYESPYLVFHEKVKTSKVFIRDCTMVSVYPILLFGGGINIDLDKGNFVMSVDDGWIRFIASSHAVAELVKELRLELDQLMKDKIKQPTMDLCTCPRGNRIINTIVKLISTQ